MLTPTPTTPIHPCVCGLPTVGPDETPCTSCRGIPVPAHERQANLLQYALAYGIDQFTLSQLDAADSAAAWIVATLPHKLDPDHARLNDRIHALRHRVQARAQAKRSQLAQVDRLLTQLYDQDDAPEAADQDAPQESDQDRALRLLRAALVLIMTPPPPSAGGGGRLAPLQPPPPTRPSQGQQADPPHVPPARRF